MLAIQRFEKIVDSDPDRIAIVDDQRTITYGSLDSSSNRLAHYLMRSGIGRDTVVCTHLPTGVELIVALLAIGKTGGAFLAIDPKLPNPRKKLMVDACRPNAIISSKKMGWIDGNTHIVNVVEESGQIDAESCARPESQIVEGSLAYLFFTSGSTGDPRAVMVPWRSQAPPGNTAPHPTEDDRHVLKSSPMFTLVMREIFQPMTSGGQLHLLPEGADGHPDRLVDFVRAHNITLLSIVPSVLRVMLTNPNLPRCRSLRFIDCIGEVLPPEIRIAFQKKLPVQLGVTYGCTEASSATSRIFDPGDNCDEVDLGKPLPKRSVYILDEHLRPVSRGEAGHIYIGGTISLGYFENPRLTAERFIPDPYSSTRGARMYATGDHGKFSSSGSLIYLGRNDDQVQINGQRVEPAEAETVISAHVAVEQAVVMRCGALERPYLVAFVVSWVEGLTEATLREHARSHLPDYMIPARFRFLKTLPLLPSGKIDRLALSRLEAERPNTTDTRKAPVSLLERRFLEIWEDVLGLTQIGVDDDFFHLGGDSLSAVRLLTELESCTGREISLRCLVRAPTVAELVAVLEQDGMSISCSRMGLAMRVTRPFRRFWARLRSKRSVTARDVLSP